MKRTGKSFLSLSRETLRDLAPKHLDQAGGAGKITNGIGDGYGCSGPTCYDTCPTADTKCIATGTCESWVCPTGPMACVK
jgi:hypothetical protein